MEWCAKSTIIAEVILMATIDIPNDLWDFLEQQARREGRDPADLSTKVLYEFRNRITNGRGKSLALKGYGIRQAERKTRSR
jgi:hypothetical protein